MTARIRMKSNFHAENPESECDLRDDDDDGGGVFLKRWKRPGFGLPCPFHFPDDFLPVTYKCSR